MSNPERSFNNYSCRPGVIKISLHDVTGEIASDKMGYSLDENFDSIKIKSVIRQWDLKPGDVIRIESVS